MPSWTFHYIRMKRNPGNHTFQTYSDSSTGHLVFLPCFLSVVPQKVTQVADTPFEPEFLRNSMGRHLADNRRKQHVVSVSFEKQNCKPSFGNPPVPLAWYLCLLCICFCTRGVLPAVVGLRGGGPAVWAAKCIQ